MTRLRVAQDRAAVLARLRAVEPWADGTAAELAEGCALLDVLDEGQPVGAVAIEVLGNVATVKAAACSGGQFWGAVAELESGLRAAGVRTLATFTRRPGLVRRLVRRGYIPTPAHAGFTELSRSL